MGNVLVKEETLTQIADAIREKSGSSDSYRPGEMPEAILEISTYGGEGADPTKPVRFYGPYGELVYSYSVDEFNAMTDLPVLPEYVGLLGQSWNWSLENAKAVNGEIEIGSLYITDDGETRIYIELDEWSLNPKVGFKQNFANAVWIDWGDGAAMSSSEVYGDEIVSIEHEYAEPGNYTICLVPEEGAEITFVGYSTGTLLLHQTPTNNSYNMKYANAIRKIELGNNISKLTDSCFKSDNIKSVTINESIKSFDSAFAGCISLESIIFPIGLSKLNRNEFTGCYALRKILFSQNRVTSYFTQFEDCRSLKEVVISNNVDPIICNFSQCYGLSRAVLPGIMQNINADSFYECTSLKEVVIRGVITKINANAFRSCNLLEKVEIPDTVTSIGSYGFYSCFMLKDLKLPSNLVSIGNTAFGDCRSLKRVEIPKGVTTIESQAFAFCYAMTEYRVQPVTPPTLGGSTSIYVPEGCIVYVPKGSLEAYQTAEYWSAFADSMVEMEE